MCPCLSSSIIRNFQGPMISITFAMTIWVISVEATPSAAQNCLDSKSRPGKCVPLTSCPSFVEEFYNESLAQANGLDFQIFASGSYCAFDGTHFKICCAIVRDILATASNRPPRASAQFATTTRAPPFELPLFFFSSLIGNSNGGPFVFTNPPPQQATAVPPIIFQPNYPVPTTVTSSLPPPVIFNPTPPLLTQPPVVFNPTPPLVTQPPVIFNPTPPPATQPPVIFNPTPPTIYQPVPSTTAASSAVGCGISRGTTNRVVGGSEAKRGTYPWMAALGYHDEVDRNALKFLCAGSLISSTYVLSSAHCVNSNLYLVRLGAHDLTNSAEANAVNIGVGRVIVHPEFNIRSIANDIALLQLNSAAPTTNFIGTICLPHGANFLSQDFVGMNPFVAGWGATKHQGPTSNVLRDVQVPVVSRQTCGQTYKSVFGFVEFSDKLICAGNSNVDACQGDSGGPLMMPQLDGGTYRYYLLGIVSYGYECARAGFPGVYTRVASYMNWITSNMA